MRKSLSVLLPIVLTLSACSQKKEPVISEASKTEFFKTQALIQQQTAALKQTAEFTSLTNLQAHNNDIVTKMGLECGTGYSVTMSKALDPVCTKTPDPKDAAKAPTTGPGAPPPAARERK